MHPILHFFTLKNCFGYPTSTVPIVGSGVDESLSYEDVPIFCLESYEVEGSNWEAEANIISRYPYIFFFILLF